MSKTNDQNTGTLTLNIDKSKLKLPSGAQPAKAKGVSSGKGIKVEVKKRRKVVEKVEVRDEVVAVDSANIRHDSHILTESEKAARISALHAAKAKADEMQNEANAAADKKRPSAITIKKEALVTAPESKDDAGEEPVVQDRDEPKEKRDASFSQAEVVPSEPVDTRAKAPDSTANSKYKNEDKAEEVKPKPKEEKRFTKKRITVTQALSDDGEGDEDTRSLAAIRRARVKKAKKKQGIQQPKEKIVREVIVPEIISVQELSNRMAERVYDVIKKLMSMGTIATANQTIDADTAELIVEEFGHKIKRVSEDDVEQVLLQDDPDRQVEIVGRAPVVTFMGHVDHGKTSLLDSIRKSSVAEGEAGGITQHIGAYQVKNKDSGFITFLDTPGHEAFTQMRKRGANATDIVVLVVAADDGIMAQTIEAVSHAKAAEVPIIVAINKIDKPGANPSNVKSALLEHELVLEEFGGEVLSVEVSAKNGTNLDKLLDAIMLQAEFLELKADLSKRTKGVIVESRVDKNRGVVATILVQEGVLRAGNVVVAGQAWGKIRAMSNAESKKLHAAEPSVPVKVLGLDEAPEAGVEAYVVENEKQARDIVEFRKKRSRDLKIAASKKGALEDLFLQASEGGKRELPVIVKADVQGSVEAIVASLEKLSNDEVSVKFLHSGVGGINASDMGLASASNATIFGFNVRADSSAKEAAEEDGVQVKYYSIIYDLIDDVKVMLGGLLAPIEREKYLGIAEIREVFNISKKNTKVAGCFVTEGMIKRGARVRLLRDNVVIHEGSLKTLRRFKDDVKEVQTNFECGMAFENYEDIKAGDRIEAFEMVEERRELE